MKDGTKLSSSKKIMDKRKTMGLDMPLFNIIA
jgi:hypothetical protein